MQVIATIFIVLFGCIYMTQAFDLGWSEIKETLEPYGWNWDDNTSKFTMNVSHGGVRLGEELLNKIDMDGSSYRTVDTGNGEVMLTKNGCKVFSIEKRITWRAMFFAVLFAALLAVPTALFAGPIAAKFAGGKLNGAAATSHGLKWFGSFVGGGMTAGSVLLTSAAALAGSIVGAVTNLSYVLSCN